MPPANPAAVVVDVPGPGSVLGNGVFGVDAVSRDARTPGVRHDKNDPRLWDTMNHPAAVASRSAAFAFSSKGLPRKYDYRDWSSTTFILRDRAVSNFIWPLCLCVGVALGWSVLYFTVEPLRHDRYDLSEFSTMFGLVFTALGFMLVFRLSRAAIRFWDCRTAWGTIAMRGRVLVDDVIVTLGPHAPKVRVARFPNHTRRLLFPALYRVQGLPFPIPDIHSARPTDTLFYVYLPGMRRDNPLVLRARGLREVSLAMFVLVRGAAHGDLNNTRGGGYDQQDDQPVSHVLREQSAERHRQGASSGKRRRRKRSRREGRVRVCYQCRLETTFQKKYSPAARRDFNALHAQPFGRGC